MTRKAGGASITGSTTHFVLGDLRWLIEQAKDLPDSEHITLYYDQGYNQLDPGSSSMTLPSRPVS